MNCRQLLWLPVSGALAGLLLGYLVLHTGLDLGELVRLVLSLHVVALAEITVLLAFNSYLASEKWRLLDRRLSPGENGGMTRTMYFAWTAVGVGLGQIVPTQLSLALCRSLGSHVHQHRILRGAGLTIFEQLFDVIAAGLLGLASTAVVMTGGGGAVWVLCAAAAALAGFALCHLFGWMSTGGSCWAPAAALKIRLRQSSVGRNALLMLQPDVLRNLLALSLLRFAVLVIIAMLSAAAVPVEIPAWRLAAALPFAMIGNALAITPGGLGVNEWAMSSALFAFGTPFAIAVQWALVNRVLVAIAALIGGAAGMLVVPAAGAQAPNPAQLG